VKSRLPAELVTALLADRDAMLDLPPLPAWMADAACREHPDVTWFPPPGESGLEAKAICGRCLVKEECLRYALEHDLDGIWGGTTVRQRRRSARAQPHDRWMVGRDRSWPA
jgi:WhiB family redox-sensing transcriptional regulator